MSGRSEARTRTRTRTTTGRALLYNEHDHFPLFSLSEPTPNHHPLSCLALVDPISQTLNKVGMPRSKAKARSLGHDTRHFAEEFNYPP